MKRWMIERDAWYLGVVAVCLPIAFIVYRVTGGKWRDETLS